MTKKAKMRPADKVAAVDSLDRLKTRQIIQVSINDLEEDPNNPNKMGEEEIQQIVVNMKMEGFLEPILVMRNPSPAGCAYKIVNGHHRKLAAARAGYKVIPAVVWEGTEEQRRALAISMNKLRGELDLSEVARIFDDLLQDGWSKQDLTMTGFSADEVSALLEVAEDSAADTEDILKGSASSDDEDAPKQDRPLVLELTFASSAELKQAKRGLRRAAGKGRELGEGLLRLLDGDTV